MTKEETITYIIPAIKKYWNDKICDDIIKTLKQETVLKKSYNELILDKIKEDIHATAEMHEDGIYYLRDKWIDEIFEKYKSRK